MAAYLTEDRREEFNALWNPRWKKWILRWLMISSVIVVVGGVGNNDLILGLISSVPTFFIGSLLSYYFVRGTVAREISDRYKE